MAEHIYYESKDISENDSWGQSNIVDGGLALCKICSCLEGGLPTDCPGEKITYEMQEEIYKGNWDYRDNEGWVNKFNPTNISWLYGRYIKYKNCDEKFALKYGLPFSYFTEIKDKWIKDGWIEKRERNA